MYSKKFGRNIRRKQQFLLSAKKYTSLFLYNYKTQISVCALAEEKDNEILIKWHERYGNVSFQCLKNVAEKRTVFGLIIDKFNKEMICLL